MYPRIRFQGQEYLLIGDSLETGGAIATAEQYAAGECSYAHLFPDGRVMRFRQVIGSVEDIELIGKAESPITNPLETLINALTHPSWNR